MSNKSDGILPGPKFPSFLTLNGLSRTSDWSQASGDSDGLSVPADSAKPLLWLWFRQRADRDIRQRWQIESVGLSR